MSNLFCQVIFPDEKEKMKGYLKPQYFNLYFGCRRNDQSRIFLPVIVASAGRDTGGFILLFQEVG
jgi:hypothetical protein